MVKLFPVKTLSFYQNNYNELFHNNLK